MRTRKRGAADLRGADAQVFTPFFRPCLTCVDLQITDGRDVASSPDPHKDSVKECVMIDYGLLPKTSSPHCTTPFQLRVKYDPPHVTVNAGDLLKLLQRLGYGNTNSRIHTMVDGLLAKRKAAIKDVGDYIQLQHAMEIVIRRLDGLFGNTLSYW